MLCPALVVVVSIVAGCGRYGFDAVHDDAVHDDAVHDDAVHDDARDGGLASGACPPFATFCDGFESGDLAKWAGTTVAANATVSAASMPTHSGNWSLAAVAPPTANGQATIHQLYSPVSMGTVAIREWVNPPVPLNHSDCVLGLRNPPSGEYLVGCVNSSNHLVVTTSTTQAGIHDYTSTVTGPALDAWTCLELDFSYVNGHIQLFMADQIIIDVTALSVVPSYSELASGLMGTSFAGSRVLIDDVVFAHQHIGC